MFKVLITGVNGFIGTNLFKLFSNRGYDVLGCDYSNTIIKDKNIKRIDLSVYSDVEEMLNIDKPDIIIHCAGSADVGNSVLDPIGDFQGNVKVTHNLLFALHKLGLNQVKVVFLSSAAVYGNPAFLPIKEIFELNPLSPYALHKSLSECICNYFLKNYYMDIKIVRIFSAYGVGLRKQIFWDMHRKFVETGELIMLGTGEESRDYINVKDVIEAIYLVATKAPIEENIYNIANGKEIKIKTVVEIFAEYYGIDENKVSFCGKAREGDPINWNANITKLRSLGYTQSVDISDGIFEYVKWVKGL